jgi:hypothetical protein
MRIVNSDALSKPLAFASFETHTVAHIERANNISATKIPNIITAHPKQPAMPLSKSLSQQFCPNAGTASAMRIVIDKNMDLNTMTPLI